MQSFHYFCNKMETMEDIRRLTLPKSERLYLKKEIEELFSGKQDSFSIFPIRVVFQKTERNKDLPPVRILVSVSKRKFKRAVKRNRVKRQLREAYRKNKFILTDFINGKEYGMNIGFVWLASDLKESKTVEDRMKTALQTIKEKLC